MHPRRASVLYEVCPAATPGPNRETVGGGAPTVRVWFPSNLPKFLGKPMSHGMRKGSTREGGSDPSSQGPETALPFPQEGSDGSEASQAQPSDPVSPKASGAGEDKPPDLGVAVSNPEVPAPFDLETVIEAKRVARRDDAGDKFDPFDPARLRLSQDFAAAVGVQQADHDHPGPQALARRWFVRTHPDPAYRLQTAVMELKEDREIYLVVPDLWAGAGGGIDVLPPVAGHGRQPPGRLVPLADPAPRRRRQDRRLEPIRDGRGRRGQSPMGPRHGQHESRGL